MLYCVANSERFNLAYFMAKRIEWVTKQARLILPYGMLLIRLFDFIIGENPELQNESYVLYDCVMNPLAAQLERKPRRDRGTRRGRHSTSSSSAFDQPSSSHLNDDDDDGNDEGTSRASTPSPIRYVNSLTNQVPQEIMPRKSSKDHKNTRAYIPMISHEYRTPIKEKLKDLESCYIHEGRVVFDNFVDLNYVRSLFHFVEFECLLEINEQICPRFILEFYSQYRVSYSDEGQMFVEFVIQNQFFFYSLEEFSQILDIPCEGACVFTDRWRLDELVYGIPSDGPYQTNLPFIEDIILTIRIDRDGQVCRIRHKEEIYVLEYQFITREIEPTLKPLEEIIWENVFCLVGNLDHVPACLCYMLYCVVHSERFNLAYLTTPI
ncbi:hypothetical protein Tco_1276915 [Tanacetum coccineum]